MRQYDYNMCVAQTLEEAGYSRTDVGDMLKKGHASGLLTKGCADNIEVEKMARTLEVTA